MPPILTSCTRHCPNGCALLVERDAEGRTITSIKGRADHPYTAGIVCAKTARFMERIASPERILAPQIRDKSTGRVREASWDEALSLVCERLDALRATPGDILHVFGNASGGLLYRASVHLFDRLGTARMSGTMCLGAGKEALAGVFGAMHDPDYSDLVKAKSVVNWGRNLDAQSPHIGRLVNEARRNGARALTVSPGDGNYAPYSDAQIVVRPGMDRFLAAAAARILLDSGRLPAAALARAKNAEAFLGLLRGQDVDALCDAAGVTPDDAAALAKAYADGPTATLLGRGLQRYAFGGENAAFVAALVAVSGNVGVAGGNVHYAAGERGLLDGSFGRPHTAAPRTFSYADLGGDLARAREEGEPVRMIWVEGTNIVTQGQDSRAIQDELARAFTVAVEPFPTDTTRCADVVLPPALMLECEDVAAPSMASFVHWSAPVVPPRGETRGNFEIAATVAARLSPPVPFPDAEKVIAQALCAERVQTTPGELRAAVHLAAPSPGVPYEGGVYAHPDGLCRLPETLHAEPAAPVHSPLRLLSTIRKRYLLSQIPMAEQQDDLTVFLAPERLQAEGFAPGETAELHGPRGMLRVRLEAKPGLSPDCVYVPRGGWLSCGQGVNALLVGREADMGGQAAYYDHWCRLARPADDERR
ncbi:molybdopterin oxidoreductase [Desulfovibrio sp. X2]|uniref:molybdopterin-dependent oxidoreductase n=1 Tax=Desulfovibrio sp. X2 TaxID=941449 RepID=UPI0003588704|nr:molybdopterin-dependent oxidoreductase [Desulfovibrio sp. X2]EPR43698.1 molybdopterin oxidoreductase [Desulfovibrio sp. X2]